MNRVAWLNLRHGVPERWAAWTAGLQRVGFTVQPGVTTRPREGDILVTWNRLQDGRLAADAFESRGLPVIVTENATWGNAFAGERWYHVAFGRHNTAGRFPVGDVSRWDAIGARLDPFRVPGGQTLILPQRGIGPHGTAMPLDWTNRARLKWAPCRVRAHPGQLEVRHIEQDLDGVSLAVTWGSGAAVKALMMGVHVHSDMPNWIGYQDNTDAGRLAMFRRLAWAQWRIDEIAQGEPIRRILDCAVRA